VAPGRGRQHFSQLQLLQFLILIKMQMSPDEESQASIMLSLSIIAMPLSLAPTIFSLSSILCSY